MGILGRVVFLEITTSALLGTVLFTFVLFLNRASRLFEMLVRTPASADTVGYLFALILPPSLPFSIAVGLLVGVLIALSRMSSDGEITALRAGGVSGRTLIKPVVAVSLVATACAAACTCWLTPFAIRETYKTINRLLSTQLSTEVQPRVFEEQFEHTMLYVGDVIPGPQPVWRNLFMADLTPASERKTGNRDPGDYPRIIIAREALAIGDPAQARIRLSMKSDVRTYEAGKDPSQYDSTVSGNQQMILEAQRKNEVRTAKPFTEMDMGPLWREARNSVEARIELHWRLALPPACLLLALVGIPLGISSRKGGKSAAFVITVALALAYWTSLISLTGLAKQGRLPVGVAIWLPNAVLLIAAVILLARLERPSDLDIVGTVLGSVERAYAALRQKLPRPPSSGRGAVRAPWMPSMPQILDTYVLNSFLFYFLLLLASFVLTSHVFFFFELLGDILRNNIPMSRVFTYLFFLTPKLIYDSTPISVLVAVLVTFGVMAKNNEVTAVKACGVSLHRIALPVLLASVVLSGGLFAFDYYIVPDANRKQEAIRSEIKGRPVQTYLNPDFRWIMGKDGSRIYYYKYFDPKDDVMGGLNVYEFDPASFQLRRQVYAERARWEPSLRGWILQNGWARDFEPPKYYDFQGRATQFSEIEEPPEYFLREVMQEKQMNFHRLAAYIAELQQGGFNTITLQVQLQKKFSVPLFALIMAMISAPFAFLAGHRGAMAGVGVSFGVAIAYWAVSQLFEQVGNVNLLPPMLAAWSPDMLFALTGMYLLARMRT